MAKKIKRKKRKQVLTAEQIQAFRSAYERPLELRDYLQLLFAPAFLTFGLSFYLLYNPVLSILLGIAGFFYGTRFILPQTILRQYSFKSFNERNRLINLVAQLAHEKEMQVPELLRLVSQQTQGELSLEVNQLSQFLIGATEFEKIKRFDEIFRKKYAKDVLFVHFVTQLETRSIEGISNDRAISELKLDHNLQKKEMDQFLRFKKQKKQEVVAVMVGVFGTITAMEFCFGFKTWYEAYAHSLVGYIFTAIYLSAIFVTLHCFIKRYFDDMITEIKVKF